MKKMMGLAVLAIGLLTLPCAAYAGMFYTDILVTPQVPSAFFGGVAGGDGNPGGLGIDWGIGNTVPFQSVTDDMVFSTCTGDFMTGTNWKERLRITKYGNVGIGTASPETNLHVVTKSTGFPIIVAGSEPNIGLDATRKDDPRFWCIGNRYRNNCGQSFIIRDETAGLDRVVVSNIGNVGIGTALPSEKLEVNGYVLADGFNTGDIIFRKDNKPVWRMYEDEKGLYVQSLTTKKKYSLVLQAMGGAKAGKIDNQDLQAELQVLQAKNSALEARLAKLEALFSKGN